MASAADHREAGHAHSVAPTGVPAVALEIQSARASADSGGPAPADRDHGDCESHVGRGTDCSRAAPQARDSNLAANGQAVHASEAVTGEDANAGVELVHPQSREDCPRVRLFRRRHRNVSRDVRLRGLGGRCATNPALDFLIPLNERHLRSVLREWGAHYHRGRPHASLGPGYSGSIIGAASRTGRPPLSSGGPTGFVNRDPGRAASRIPIGTGCVQRVYRTLRVFAEDTSPADAYPTQVRSRRVPGSQPECGPRAPVTLRAFTAARADLPLALFLYLPRTSTMNGFIGNGFSFDRGGPVA